MGRHLCCLHVIALHKVRASPVCAAHPPTNPAVAYMVGVAPQCRRVGRSPSKFHKDLYRRLCAFPWRKGTTAKYLRSRQIGDVLPRGAGTIRPGKNWVKGYAVRRGAPAYAGTTALPEGALPPGFVWGKCSRMQGQHPVGPAILHHELGLGGAPSRHGGRGQIPAETNTPPVPVPPVACGSSHIIWFLSVGSVSCVQAARGRSQGFQHPSGTVCALLQGKLGTIPCGRFRQ